MLYHFDAYRLRDAVEMERIGCAETFESGGVSGKIFLEVDNVFNNRRVRRIDSETGEVPVPGVGSYVEDAGSVYGALRHGDPNYYGPPRRATLGMGIEW